MHAIQAFQKSSSFTLSIIFTSLLMLGVIFTTYFLVIANDNLLIRESEAAINADIQGFTSLHELAGIEAVASTLRSRMQNSHNDFFYHLRSQQGQFIAGNLPFWPKPDAKSVKNGMLSLQVSTTPLELEELLAKVMTFEDGHELLIGRNVDELAFVQWMSKTFGWAMIIVLCLISATSIWVAYYVVNRINEIADHAEKIINTGNLSARLPVDSDWDDLSKLTLALNFVLAQIEQAFMSVKAVSDNIAHDLRTPLTRLRHQVEALGDSPAKTALLAECDNLMSIFNSLLRIAQIESQQRKKAFDKHRVNDIVADVIDLYQPMADAKNMRFTVHLHPQTVNFMCDRDLLFQAFANLLDNAIKFTPEEGSIEVRFTAFSVQDAEQQTVAQGWSFGVFDNGPGVLPLEFEKLTTRFYRGDKSRTHKGNGLGLALVKAVAQLHEGKLTFTRDPLMLGCGLGCELVFDNQAITDAA